MIKFKVLLIDLMIISSALFSTKTKAQEKISDDYDRSSISIVYVSRGDIYDSQIKEYIRKYFMNTNWETKFDINVIPTTEIKTKAQRDVEISPSTISGKPIFKGIGKEILSYWFNRQNNGMMSNKITDKRARYNVTDQDYFNAKVTSVGLSALSADGYDLVKNSFLILLDYSDIKRMVDENDSKKISWSSDANIHVYKLDYTEAVFNNIVNSWIYEDDSESAKKEKIEVWNNMNVNMNYVTSVKASSSAFEEKYGGLEKSVIDAYQKGINMLENKISVWNVASAITDTKPLRAKIGKKEGLKNKSRYRAYIYTEDENGNVKPVAKGYVRATKIAQNNTNAEGRTPKSEFYQISGYKIEEGATLKQSNDIGMGLSVSYREGAFKGYYLGIDQLINIKTNGISQYAILNMGYDFYTEKKLNEHNIEITEGSGISFFNVSLGYGVGVRPILRHLEFVPYVLIGIDNIHANQKDDSNDKETFNKKIALTGAAGLKVNINLFYPLLLTGSVDYTGKISQGEIYKVRNDVLNDIGRKDGVGINVGVKYIF